MEMTTSKLGYFLMGALTGIMFLGTIELIRWHVTLMKIWYLYPLYLFCMIVIKMVFWEESITGA